jgi:hypothetical protein
MEIEVMVFAINLLIIAIPTTMLAVAWNRLVADLRNGVVHNAAGTACLTFASVSTLVALGSLFWQVFIRPISSRDYRTVRSSSMISLMKLGFSGNSSTCSSGRHPLVAVSYCTTCFIAAEELAAKLAFPE